MRLATQVEGPSPATLDSVFSAVLSRPEFQYTGTSPLERWIAGALGFVSDLLSRWFPTLSGTQIRYAQGLVFLVVFAGFAIFILRWARGRGSDERRSPNVGGVGPTVRDARSWRRWADSAATEGRLREAATGLYQAVILHLDGQGAVHHEEWKTPGDYLDEVKDETLRPPLREFLESFVRLAFGRRQPTQDDFELLDDSADRLGCPT